MTPGSFAVTVQGDAAVALLDLAARMDASHEVVVARAPFALELLQAAIERATEMGEGE